MKVKSIPRHTIQHIWKAYVKNISSNKSDYWTKFKDGFPCAIYYNTPGGQVKLFMDYELFRNVCERFLLQARKAIINGESIEIPRCGFIAGKRIERDFRAKKKTIDWKRTVAGGFTMIEVDGEMKKKYNKIYYQLKNDYCRIGWIKPTISNITVYSFLPTASSSKSHATNPTIGFKEAFSQNLVKDQFIKYKYIFCPLRELVPNTD